MSVGHSIPFNNYMKVSQDNLSTPTTVSCARGSPSVNIRDASLPCTPNEVNSSNVSLSHMSHAAKDKAHKESFDDKIIDYGSPRTPISQCTETTISPKPLLHLPASSLPKNQTSYSISPKTEPKKSLPIPPQQLKTFRSARQDCTSAAKLYRARRPVGPRHINRIIGMKRYMEGISGSIFHSQPVPWRGLTMDAAKWTLTSTQLQEIVGCAIRKRAEASSIRIILPEAFNTEIPEAIQHLEIRKTHIIDNFLSAVQRRQFHFRKLSHPDGKVSFSKSLQDLMEISTVCDRLSVELFHVMDELQQLHRLCDDHSSSALSIALRKLNSAFLKQSVDMTDMRKHMTQLQAERNEAWKIAERVEMDLIELQNTMEALKRTDVIRHYPSKWDTKRGVSAARTASTRVSEADLRFPNDMVPSRSPTTESKHISHITVDGLFGTLPSSTSMGSVWQNPFSPSSSTQEDELKELCDMLSISDTPSISTKRHSTAKFTRPSLFPSPSAVQDVPTRAHSLSRKPRRIVSLSVLRPSHSNSPVEWPRSIHV